MWKIGQITGNRTFVKAPHGFIQLELVVAITELFGRRPRVM
jgi:hypothetical protein